MLNIFGSFEASKRSMQAQLGGILTTSHNISNANTEGYSRQQVTMGDVAPNQIPQGWIGNGVEIKEIRRIYDQFLNNQINSETANLSDWKIKNNTLENLQMVFDESSGVGFNDVLNNFWNGWQGLINNPENSTNRLNVKELGKTLVNKFNSISSKINDISKNLDNKLIEKVNSVNSLTQEIADINQQIKVMSAGGEANDLKDRLDMRIEELFSLVDADLIENADQTVTLTFSGGFLVDGTQRMELTTDSILGSPYHKVVWADTGTDVNFQSGEIKGIIDSRDDIVNDYKDKFDSIASTLITEMNSVHRNGIGMDGSSKVKGANVFTGTFSASGSFELNGVAINVTSGETLDDLITNINNETINTGIVATKEDNKLVLSPDVNNTSLVKITADPDDIMLDLGITSNFFAGTDASDIELDSVIMTDINKIAASSSGAPGDNNNAINLYKIRDNLLLDNNASTLNDYYAGFISTLGVEGKEASNYETTQSVIVDRLKTQKQSAVGVSLDEEMANLLLYQNAYQAAAKVISVINEMMDVIINM